ncbi:MAG: LysM peptidoglycan-binding domain-containing protein [Oscillospiraceae bacterium]|nr:LysM peptidoglycan-binding domain-containing protein [Oscillospiraceae bacterium]
MKSNAYQIWFEADSIKLQIPVNPESFKVQKSGNNDSVTIVGLGEATVISAPKAIKISFSSIFPKTYFPGCNVQKPLIPHFYITAISSWMNEKIPIRLYITKCDIVRYMTIEDFSYSQSGGDVGSYDYSITFKEYRAIRVRQININNKKANILKNQTPRVNTQKKPKTYTAKSGDTLYKIAKKYYGDGSYKSKIYDANKKVIGSNPNDIKGKTLTLP